MPLHHIHSNDACCRVTIENPPLHDNVFERMKNEDANDMSSERFSMEDGTSSYHEQPTNDGNDKLKSCDMCFFHKI